MSATHAERLRLRYRPDDLFTLVGDVRRYPEFLKQISAMRITREREHAGKTVLEAEARVKYKFVREKFTTRVTLDPEARTIDVAYLSGPFDDLANLWRFSALEDGSTLVDFWIRYGFRNPVLQMLMDTSRARAIAYLIGAFEAEASQRFERVGDADYDLSAELAAIAPLG